MKICVFSDMHGDFPIIAEKCELVCICGDIVPLSIQANSHKTRKWLVEKFKPWCEALPCDKVIFIAGNHDIRFDNLDFMYSVFPKDGKVTYLFHELYTYTSKSGKEYEIFGTPYCKLFGNWAFMEMDNQLTKLYSDIPEGINILLSHDTPFGYNDIILDNVPWADGSHIGNKPLALAILEKQPSYVFCGHLHSVDRSMIEIGKSKKYNVSIKNERYEVVHDPLYIEV